METELVALYRNPYCTLDRFLLFDHHDRAEMTTCALDEPRHVVLITVQNTRAMVLNKLLPIDCPEMDRLVQAIRRCFPSVRRLSLETTCDPARLHVPHWLTGRDHDYVIERHASATDWGQRLSKKTRKNIRNMFNRLTRDHPGWEQRWIDGRDVQREHVEDVVNWTRERMRVKNRVSGLDTPGMAENVLTTVRRYGGAFETVVDGRVAARELCLHMGDACWIEHGSFDRRYEGYDLGVLSLYGAICRFIDLGATIHLLWGTAEFKTRLGARERHQWQLSLYTSRLAQLRDVREGRRAARQALRGSWIDRSWHRWRWRAHRAVTLLRRR